LWKCKYDNRLTENQEGVEINFKENPVGGGSHSKTAPANIKALPILRGGLMVLSAIK
jgi:hypothetical protein